MTGATVSTMNRAQRRAGNNPPGSITLSGGPMDGWVVRQGAPVLNPGWHETWPPTITGGKAARLLHRMGRHNLCRWHPGRYIVEGHVARWVAL